MAKSFTWFATKTDTELVLDWMRSAGAVQINGTALPEDWQPDGRELVMHFPAVGPVKYWPSQIELNDYEENSPRWRRAVLTSAKQQQQPDMRQVDPDQSAVGGLRFPEYRDDRYWIAGHVWFPTAKLKDTFPELNRLCQRFERFLKKQALVFDNLKGSDTRGYGNQICETSIVQRMYAFPEAKTLLDEGKFMVDFMASPKTYENFRTRLRLAGHEK